jgi:Fic family protein
MCSEGALTEPLLYLSLYFKKNRRQYFDLLQDVRMEGEWERWLAFFLQGVVETSEQAVETARRILALFEEDRKKIEKLGSSGGSALRVHHLLQKKVYTSISTAVADLKLTYPTVSRSMDELTKIGVVQEVTGQRRGRIFAYGAYLRLLSEGTEPLGEEQKSGDIASGQTRSEPAAANGGSSISTA